MLTTMLAAFGALWLVGLVLVALDRRKPATAVVPIPSMRTAPEMLEQWVRGSRPSDLDLRCDERGVFVLVKVATKDSPGRVVGDARIRL